jgi:transcriptional regulator GlxA family with amidase domain
MEASLGEPLRLADIADVAAMAPFHFLRAFKELFGVTPHRYLVARRLERAKRLLLTTDLSVTEVGLSVGFDSLGSFSSLFRRRTAASPEAYRRRQTTK